MANLTVRIYSHEKKADGKWTFVPVDISLDSRQTKQVPGAFKLSWYQGGAKQFSKGHFLFLADAIRAGKQKQLELHDAMDGVQPVAEPGRVRIDVAAEAYLKFTKLRRRPGSYHLAEHDVQEFQHWNNENSKRTYVDQISADDLLTYRNWLLGHGYKFERDKDRKITATRLHTGTRSPRTAVNKTMRIIHFYCLTHRLKENGEVEEKWKLKAGDGPIKQKAIESIIVNPPKNDVEYYDENELARFFGACDARQNLLFSVFNESGCRREEIEFLLWTDLDFEEGILRVTQKPEFDFVTKTRKEREIPLPMDLIARLKAWKETSNSRLVFPTSCGNPLGNSLLVACKRIARRAGLNCGVCKGCLKNQQCERFYLHKFRSTFATRMLQAGMDVATLQELLGHEDLSSTMRYLGNLRKKALREKVEEARYRATTAIPELVTDSVQ